MQDEMGARDPHLSVELDRRESLELVPAQVRVVRGGDEVVRQRLVEVAPRVALHGTVVAAVPGILLGREVQAAPPAPAAPLAAGGDGRVVRVHQVAGEALEAQLVLRPQHGVGLVQLQGGPDLLPCYAVVWLMLLHFVEVQFWLP